MSKKINSDKIFDDLVDNSTSVNTENPLQDVVDTACGRLMAQIDIANNIKNTCSDLGLKEVVPLLEGFIKRQDEALKEIFDHTSQIFQYCVYNKGKGFVEGYKG